jgi:hypothetical protein
VKTFRSAIVLKRPQQELWKSMRDHLVEVAEHIADIESICQLERTIDADGKICIVNEWTVQRALPSALSTMLKVDKFSWIDRNKWDEANQICSWTIQPAVFGEHIACSGETQFTAAMGNRGTRITFAGELDIKPALLAAVGFVGPMMAGFVESVVTTMIPRNMRAVAEAAAEFGARDRDYPINAP